MGIPNVLSMYRGMLCLLYSQKCVRLNLMNGCEVRLKEIIFAPDEATDMPTFAAAGAPICLHYMPVCMLLRATGAKWTLPTFMMPSFREKDFDRRGLFLLYPGTRYLKRESCMGHRAKALT